MLLGIKVQDKYMYIALLCAMMTIITAVIDKMSVQVCDFVCMNWGEEVHQPEHCGIGGKTPCHHLSQIKVTTCTLESLWLEQCNRVSIRVSLYSRLISKPCHHNM